MPNCDVVFVVIAPGVEFPREFGTDLAAARRFAESHGLATLVVNRRQTNTRIRCAYWFRREQVWRTRYASWEGRSIEDLATYLLPEQVDG